MRLQTKSARAEFKAVDDAPAGTFEAIVSVFGNVDLGGDRVVKGAFTQTLAAWQASGDPIPVIWSHEWDDPKSHIGYVEEAEERDEGLYVKAVLDVAHNDRAEYVARLLKERRVTQFSFGYFARDYEDVEDETYGKVRELKRIDLFEVGPTLLGMNPETVLLEAASFRFGKATPEEAVEGAFATWMSGDDTMIGRIEHVMTDGVLGVPGSSFQIEATADNPAVLLRIFDNEDGTWVETEMLVGRRASEVTIVPDPTRVGTDPEAASASPESKIDAPGWMRDNARQGLEWYEAGLAGDGVVEATIREARDMAAGTVSDEKAVKMSAWFARHMESLDAPAADPDHEDYPSPGVVAHALWGGGSRSESERAKAWADDQVARIERERENSKTADDADDADGSRDTEGTIDIERLSLLLSRPQHMEDYT